jgi:putative SOS response-associated peptidase YedK
MCGRFTLNATPEVIAKTFNLQEIPDLSLRYNIAPGQNIAVVCHFEETNRLDLLNWGFIPDGLKGNKQPLISARTETVNEESSFKNAIKHSRCIIPATGFFVWKHEDNREQPYYVRLLNSGIMGFAGIWESWKTEDGTVTENCCILTTSANDLIQPIHERMPVILSPDEYKFWLDKNVQHPIELQRLYQPYPSELMVAHEVPDLVNNPRFDSPSCILQM